MFKLSNFSAAHKVIALVITMSCFIIGFGLTCIYFIDKIIFNLDNNYERLLKVECISEITGNTRANEANMLRLLITKSPDMREKILKDINTKTNEIKNQITDFEKSNLYSYERDSFIKLEKEIKDYWEIRDRIINMSSSYSSDMERIVENNKAYRIYLKAAPVLDDVNKDIRQFTSYYNKKTIENNRKIRDYIDKIKSMLLISIFLAVIVSLCAGLLVSKGIAQSFTNFAENMQKTKIFLSDSSSRKSELIKKLKNALDDEFDDRPDI